MNFSGSEALIGIKDEKEKEEEAKNPIQHYVKFSFMITYVLLLTTGVITFIEALRTNNPQVRHILNLETAISVIAGYFYSTFVTQIDKFTEQKKNIDWADLTQTRYVDWSITTPLMLLTLCVVLGMNTKVKLHFPTFVIIVVLNYFMLFLGYLGETQILTRTSGMIFGFIPFFAMFYLIYRVFVLPKPLLANYILFGIYFIVWSMYGLVYMLSEEWKNITTNILDFIAKSFVGIGLWAYYTKIII